MTTPRDGSSRAFTVHDLLSGGNEFVRQNKPRTLDMDRITEIVLEMKSIPRDDQQEFERLWRAHVGRYIDFDSLAWQAFQVALDIMAVRNGHDFRALRADPRKNRTFVSIMQGFYDGFLLGTAFQERRAP